MATLTRPIAAKTAAPTTLESSARLIKEKELAFASLGISAALLYASVLKNFFTVISPPILSMTTTKLGLLFLGLSAGLKTVAYFYGKEVKEVKGKAPLKNLAMPKPNQPARTGVGDGRDVAKTSVKPNAGQNQAAASVKTTAPVSLKQPLEGQTLTAAPKIAPKAVSKTQSLEGKTTATSAKKTAPTSLKQPLAKKTPAAGQKSSSGTTLAKPKIAPKAVTAKKEAVKTKVEVAGQNAQSAKKSSPKKA